MNRIIAAFAALALLGASASAETFNGRFPQHDFTLQPRTLSDLSFPVPTFQPRELGKVIALDLHPSPGAVESAGNGFSWVDACDADVMHSNANPVRCARLGMQSRGAVIGSMVYNGAPPLPLFFQVNGFYHWAINPGGVFYPVEDAILQIGSNTNRVTDIYLSGIAAPVAGYPAVSSPASMALTIQQLKAQIVSMSARMDRAGLAP